MVTCSVVRVKSWSWSWKKKSWSWKNMEVLVLVLRPRVLVLILVLTKKSYLHHWAQQRVWVLLYGSLLQPTDCGTSQDRMQCFNNHPLMPGKKNIIAEWQETVLPTALVVYVHEVWIQEVIWTDVISCIQCLWTTSLENSIQITSSTFIHPLSTSKIRTQSPDNYSKLTQQPTDHILSTEAILCCNHEQNLLHRVFRKAVKRELLVTDAIVTGVDST